MIRYATQINYRLIQSLKNAFFVLFFNRRKKRGEGEETTAKPLTVKLKAQN